MPAGAIGRTGNGHILVHYLLHHHKQRATGNGMLGWSCWNPQTVLIVWEMGISGLLQGLSPFSGIRNVRDFSNQALASDASFWLVSLSKPVSCQAVIMHPAN